MISLTRAKEILKRFASRERIPFVVTVTLIVTVGLWILGILRPDETSEGKATLAVQVMKLVPEDDYVTIVGYGTVEPKKSLEVYAQVSGNVKTLHPQFEEGGRIQEGEAIVTLDASDYEIAVEAQKATVAHAENDLKLEDGNQKIARYEYEIFKKDLGVDKEHNELALREPQLRDKEVALQAAQNQLKKSLLDLSRTTISAPFPALVLKRNVTTGSLVNPGSSIAQLASYDSFFIKVKVPNDNIEWVSFDAKTGMLSHENIASVVFEKKDGSFCARPGIAERIVSNLEASGRMTQILVAVQDPMVSVGDCAPLLLGSYVRVEILGKMLENILKIPRSAFREGNKLYIADKNKKLRIHTPTILFEAEEHLWIKNTFNTNEFIILSDVQIPLNGMNLTLEILGKKK